MRYCLWCYTLEILELDCVVVYYQPKLLKKITRIHKFHNITLTNLKLYKILVYKRVHEMNFIFCFYLFFKNLFLRYSCNF